MCHGMMTVWGRGKGRQKGVQLDGDDASKSEGGSTVYVLCIAVYCV